MKRPEQVQQIKFAKWCSHNLAPEVVWWATYQNAHNAHQGAINKAMGVRAGISDMIFSWGKNIGFIEMKSKGGNLAPVQAQFLDAMAARGHYTAVAWGCDDAIRIIKEWELPMVEHETPDLPF